MHLDSNKEDSLKRRLQTIFGFQETCNYSKTGKTTNCPQACFIANQIVSVHHTKSVLEEEPHVKLNIVLKLKPEKKSKIEEIKEAVLEDEIQEEKDEEEQRRKKAIEA